MMSPILGICGLALSGYAVWTGWRIFQLAGLPYMQPEVLIAQYLLPLEMLVPGLLLLGAAEALSDLSEVRSQSRQIAASLLTLQVQATAPRSA